MWVIGNINSTSEPSILLYVSHNYALTHDNATLHFYTGKKVEHKTVCTLLPPMKTARCFPVAYRKMIGTVLRRNIIHILVIACN